MLDSCTDVCLHWTAASTHSKTFVRPPIASFTWLKMNGPIPTIAFNQPDATNAQTEEPESVPEDALPNRAGTDISSRGGASNSTVTDSRCRVLDVRCLSFSFIVVGAMMLCCLVLCGGCCFWSRRNRKENQVMEMTPALSRLGSRPGSNGLTATKLMTSTSNSVRSNPVSGVATLDRKQDRAAAFTESTDHQSPSATLTSNSSNRSHHSTLRQAW